MARGSRALRLLVGQIRAHPAGPGGSPDQTSSDVWYSPAPDDGRPAAVRRLPVTPDQHGELRQVPVVTPFAYGGYGLVLPRYPGERVLLADTGGGQDVVDLGSVWDDGRDAARRAGRLVAGPAGGGADRRPRGRTRNAAPPADGFASHDLIDADGRRIVEVSGLTLRVADILRKYQRTPGPGRRPGVVLLENTKDGKTARIELHDDGTHRDHRHRDHPRRRHRRHHPEGGERQGLRHRHDGRELMARPKVVVEDGDLTCTHTGKRSLTAPGVKLTVGTSPVIPLTSVAGAAPYRMQLGHQRFAHPCITTVVTSTGAAKLTVGGKPVLLDSDTVKSVNDVPTTFPATVHPGPVQADRLVRTP